MDFDFAVPTVLDYFATLVQDDDSLALTEAAISIAQDVAPSLDIASVSNELDGLAATLKRRLPGSAPTLHKLLALNHYFFRELQFAGNVNNYYDPQNSYVHTVLRTRRGIPISLAVVWLELANSIGLAAQGINFPGHFLVRIQVSEGQVIIDPMNGSSLDADELMDRLYQAGISPEPDESREAFLSHYLKDCSIRDILARMLRNLKEIYKSQQHWERVLQIQERMIVLYPTALWPQHWHLYRDRGLIFAHLNRTAEAMADLHLYLEHEPEAQDAHIVRLQLEQLQKQMPR